MTASLKNSNGFVRFLLRHGEKIGIVVLLAVAGMLFYSSLGRERLEQSELPPAIQTSAQQADTHIEQMSWESFPPEEKVPPATEFPVAAFTKPVPADGFPLLPLYNRPIVPPMELRTDPVLLTVRDVEVSSGSGIWATIDPEESRRRRLADLAAAARADAEAADQREREMEEGGRGRGGYGGEGGMGGYGGESQITRSGGAVVRPKGGTMTDGTEIIRAKSWVIVKAVVPLGEQLELFKDAFENARGYSDEDFPTYIGYQVERADVSAGGPEQWQSLGSFSGRPKNKFMRTISEWPVETPEVVKQDCVHPLLTFPLPPMVLRMWGEEVTHTSMPLPTPEELSGFGELLEEPADEATEEDSAEESDDPFARRRRQPQGGLEGGYGREGYGGGYGPPGGGYGREGGGYGREGGGYGPPGGGGYGGRGGYGLEGGGYGREGGGGYGGRMMGRGGVYGMSDAGDLQLPEYVWDGKTKRLLFRFFDSSVRPGGRYKYRVRLVLSDPNADAPPQYLAPEVSARLEEQGTSYRFTEWSEPSRTAVVPPPGLIYVAGGQPATPSNYSSEPEAELVIKTLDAAHAAEAAVKEEFTRGSVINMREHAKVIWSNEFKADDTVEEPEFNFNTGVTLLDVTGGEKLPNSRDLTAPARVLLMDSGGRLMIEDELDDYATVRQYNAIVEAADEMRRAANNRDDDRGRRRRP